MQEKTVVVIVGDGRSGSTIVDMVLGEYRDAFSVGELRFFWQRGVKLNQLCGCGQTFHQCEFWSKIQEKVYSSVKPEARQILLDSENYGSLIKYPIECLRVKVSASRSRYHRSLIEAYDQIYDQVFQLSGARVIVDSSKSVYYADFLQRYSRHKIKFLHVIRDSRAVAYSKQKEKRRKEIHTHEEMMPRTGLIKSSIKWLAVNWLSGNIGTSQNRMLTRYEDFATNPLLESHRIGRFLEWEMSEESAIVDEQGYVEFHTQHTISGNPSRFTDGPVKVNVDSHWESKLPAWKKHLVTLITLPGLQRFYRNSQ